jgi:hypothetical protein
MSARTAAMDVQEDPLFCGYCAQGLLSSEGRWQKYGDHWEMERKWIFLCRGCSKHFWRLYTKDEEFHDFHSMCKEYGAWLKNELYRN